MLYNEKRAHDLALLTMTYRLNHIKGEAPAACENADSTEYSIELTEIYMEAYDIALGFFNRTFPGKNE